MNDKTSKGVLDKSEIGNTSKSIESKWKRFKGKSSKKKGSKKGYKPRQRGSEFTRGVNKGANFNDVSWYKRNPAVVEAYTKLPFNYIIGNKPAGTGSANSTMYLPAISSYVIDWITSVVDVDPSTASIRDILNEVATIVYTNLRRHNSGSTNNIEFVDVLTSNLLAGIDILVNAVYGRRVFRIANSFSWKNRLIPRFLFQLMGFDYDDFIQNQATYRGRYNTIVSEARTIKVLNNYPFVNAIMAEFENIFKDSDTDTGREQLLIGVKYFHHIYDAVGTQAHPGGMVRIMTLKDVQPTNSAEPLITGPITPSDIWQTPGGTTEKPGTMPFSKFLDVMQTQINALINDSDFNLIQADLEKAFGEQGSYLVADFTNSDDTISPIYSGELWEMIHNGTFLPTPRVNKSQTGFGYLPKINGYVNTVYQYHNETTGEVKMGTHFHYTDKDGNITNAPNPLAGMLDSGQDVPSDDDIIIMTRYKSIYERVSSTDISKVPPDMAPASPGVNVVIPKAQSNFVVFGGLSISIYFSAGSQNGIMYYKMWDNYSTRDLTEFESGMPPLLGYEHRPLYNVLIDNISNINFLQNDIGNLRCLTVDELFNIHEGCYLSLWSLPELV